MGAAEKNKIENKKTTKQDGKLTWPVAPFLRPNLGTTPDDKGKQRQPQPTYIKHKTFHDHRRTSTTDGWLGREGILHDFPPLPRYSEKAATHPITSESQDQHPAQRG